MPRPRPHATSLSRTRAAALLLTLILFIATIAGWIASEFTMFGVKYRWGEAIAPGERAGEPDMWTFPAHSLMLNQVRGGVFLGVRLYRSLAPERSGLQSWENWHGWQTTTIPLANVVVEPNQLFRWDAGPDISILGAGLLHSNKLEDIWVASIPHWMLAALLAGLAWTLWAPARRRALRRRRNQCPHCAYDLLATPSGTPCPECGHELASPAR